MANWDEIRTTAKKAASKAVKKTEELADMAALRIRFKSLEAKRDEQYRLLGKLTYRQLKTGESQAERIAPVIEELDSLRAKLRAVTEEIETAKAAKKEPADESACEACEKEEPSCEQE